MNDIRKPELTPKQLTNINALEILLIAKKRTKSELMTIFNTNERKIRLMIAEIAKHKPVISVSTSKGYKIAVDKRDLSDAIQQWQELDNRIRHLDKRRKTIIKFCEHMEKSNDNT